MPYADYQQQLQSNRDRQRTPRGAAIHGRANKAYLQRNPKKRAAHNAVAKAISRGKMLRWPCCALSDCSSVEVEAHHVDYNAPLDVVWLCSIHHKEVHALARKLKET